MRQLATLLFLCIVWNGFLCADPAPKKVFLSQVVDHPALNSTTQGIIDALEEAGYSRGSTLEMRIESAQANSALASQIASKFVGGKPDVVVAVGTLSAQSLAKYAAENKVSLIFSSVTDPLGAELVESLNKPGRNTTGVSNFVDIEPQLLLFKKMQPKLTRLGVLYNPGEANSVSIVSRLEKLCPLLGLSLVKQTASKTADVAQNAVKLASRVDAIFISNDNTSLSGLQSVVRAAQASKIPVYVSDTVAVELGAVAALGPNQYEVGQQTGRMVARVLQGETVGAIPVEFPESTDLYLNLEAARKAGITIPPELLKEATRVIEKSKA